LFWFVVCCLLFMVRSTFLGHSLSKGRESFSRYYVYIHFFSENPFSLLRRLLPLQIRRHVFQITDNP
jgi:hypothetical protein